MYRARFAPRVLEGRALRLLVVVCHGTLPVARAVRLKRSGTAADGDVHGASSNELRWDPCLLGKSRSRRARLSFVERTGGHVDNKTTDYW